MNLWEAPFNTPLRVQSLQFHSDEVRLVLVQLGIDEGEILEKLHVAPLGDPLSVMIGQQVFSLRFDICKNIQVSKSS